RVQQIINAAHYYGRKVVVEGRSMVNIIDIAQQLHRISIPENTLIDVESLKKYPAEKTVIITTGSQGESMAALSRMANGTHKKVSIGPNDTVIFSSNPIPGNEKAVTKIINELLLKGADVIFQDAHVSGHACQEEIKLIYSLVQPKYAIPVHGEYKHLMAQAKIAGELGIEKKNTLILRSGDVLEIDEDSAKVTGKVPCQSIYVDGLGVGDVGNSVLRDRQHLSESGVVVATIVVDKEFNYLLSGPEINTRGFVYEKESEELLLEAKKELSRALNNAFDKNVSDWGKLKGIMKDTLADFFWKKNKRRPVIVPIISEV
ncbi:MAG: ribonuclease J, partial [Lachnospiraceae bacterium]|nr:ribonuclease J [Lachnospiraceae bacterium]